MSSSHSRRTLLLAMPLVLVLAACNFRSIVRSDAIEAEPALVSDSASVIPYGVLTNHPCPNIFEPPCADGTGCNPNNNEIVATGPQDFEWSYGCNPDGYRFSLHKLGDDGYRIIVADVTDYDTSLHGPARSYQWTEALERATHYRWEISAFQSSIFPEGFDYVTRNDFWTGPICEDPDELVAPDPRDPGDGWSLNTSEPSYLVRFRWQYSPTDCVPTAFYGQVAEDEDFTRNVTSIVTAPRAPEEGESSDPLARCRTYYWRVRATLGEGGGGPWSESMSFRILPYGGAASCYTIEGMLGRARVDAACRLGPGTAYRVANWVAPGDEHPLAGRNAPGTWLMLSDLRCYISTDLLEVEPEDAIKLLKILPDPPLPTVPPTEEPHDLVCRSDLAFQACKDAGGTPQTGYCQCPKN